VSSVRRRSVSGNKENAQPSDVLIANNTTSDGSSVNNKLSDDGGVVEFNEGDTAADVDYSGLHSAADWSGRAGHHGTGSRPMSVVLENHSPVKVAATADNVTSESTKRAQVVTSSRALPDSSSAAAAAAIGNMIKSISTTMKGGSATGWSDKTNTDCFNPLLSKSTTPLISEIKTCSASSSLDTGNTPATCQIQSRDPSHQTTRTDTRSTATSCVNPTPSITNIIYNGRPASNCSTNTIASSSVPPSTTNSDATNSHTGLSTRARPAVPHGLHATDPFRRFTYCSSDDSHQMDNSQPRAAETPSNVKQTNLPTTPARSVESSVVGKATKQSLQDQMSSSADTSCQWKSSRPAQSMPSTVVMKTAYSVDNIASVCSPRPLKAVTSSPPLELETINPTTKQSLLSMSNRHSTCLPLSTSTTVTPSRQAINITSAQKTPLEVGIEQPTKSDVVTVTSSPPSVVELRRHQARNVLTNLVSDALFGKRQSAPLMTRRNEATEEIQKVPVTKEENGPSGKTRTEVVTLSGGKGVGNLPETGRAATIISSSLSAARPASWAPPNKVDNLIGQKATKSQHTPTQKTLLTSSQSTDSESLVRSNALTSATPRTSVAYPLRPGANNHQVSHQQNDEKPDWQVEAERRRAIRNGNYVDPAMASPAEVRTAVRKGILKGASSMENILAPTRTEYDSSSTKEQVTDAKATNETPFSLKSSAFQTVPSSVPEGVVSTGVVMRGHEELKMTDRAVDIVQPSSRHSIIIDPARQRIVSKRSQMLSAKSVDNLSMLSDRSFGLSPSHISDDNDEVERGDGSSVSRTTTGSFAVANRSVSHTANATGNESQTYYSPKEELQSTDCHVEVRRVTSDHQRPHTIIIDSKQFSKKLVDSAARLAASMDDLSTPSAGDKDVSPTSVGTGNAEYHLKRCTEAFSSADDILCSSFSSAVSKLSKSTRPVIRVPAFKIVDSVEDNDTDNKEKSLLETGSKPAALQPTDPTGRTKVIVGSEISIQIRLPHMTGNGSSVAGSGSGGSSSTFDILVEPATPTDVRITLELQCCNFKTTINERTSPPVWRISLIT